MCPLKKMMNADSVKERERERQRDRRNFKSKRNETRENQLNAHFQIESPISCSLDVFGL